MALDEKHQNLAKDIERIEEFLESTQDDLALNFCSVAMNLISNNSLNSKPEDILKYMLEEKSFKVNEPDNLGNYPIYYAAGSLETTKFLIAEGVDIDANSKSGKAIENAVIYGRKDVVELLIKEGTKLDIVNQDGNNLFHLVAQNHHPKRNRDLLPIAELLIDKNININAKNKQGKTPLDITGEEDLRTFLTTHRAKNSNPFLDKINNFVKAIINNIKNIFYKIFKKSEISESELDSVLKINSSSTNISPDNTPQNKTKHMNKVRQ